MRTIHIVNASSVVTDLQVEEAVTALQIQVDRDFFPVYGIDCKLVTSKAPPPGSEGIWIINTTDQPGVLAYHTSTSGIPNGWVFAQTDMLYGESWTASLSHELLEQLCDAECNLVVEGVWNNKLAIISYEVADAVENDGPYQINGITVSNFVYPSWFEYGSTATKFDHLGRLNDPFTLSPGGYISYFYTLGEPWQSTFGRQVPEHQRYTKQYSRRGRRITKRDSNSILNT